MKRAKEDRLLESKRGWETPVMRWINSSCESSKEWTGKKTECISYKGQEEDDCNNASSMRVLIYIEKCYSSYLYMVK